MKPKVMDVTIDFSDCDLRRRSAGRIVGFRRAPLATCGGTAAFDEK